MQARRDDLRGQLREVVDECCTDGLGRVIRIEGEAGIGKTTLVSEVVATAADHGMTVWTAAAAPLDRATPYGVLTRLRSVEEVLIADVLRPGDAARGRAGAQPAAEVERFSATEVLIEAVEDRSQRPTVMVIEDLHWADAASLQALASIGQITLSHPLLMVVTHRSGHDHDPLAQLNHDLRSVGAIDVTVPPLSDVEVEELLATLCGGAPSAALVERAQGASGNPFLLREFVDGLLAEGNLVQRNEQIEAATADLPHQLRDAVSRRLRQLSDGTGDIVRAASVQGAHVDVGDLAAILDVAPVRLAEPIDEAVQAGLFEESDTGLRFRHDLVRDAVYQGMPSGVRAATHRQMAALLAQRGASAALVGSHVVLAGDTDAAVIEQLRLAAVETAPVAPESALDFLDRAARLCADDLATRQVIERARMEALTAAGRLTEAEDAARWLLERAPQPDRAEIRARLGGIAEIAGHSERALELLEQAREESAGDTQRAPIAALAAYSAASSGSYDRARELAREAIETGARVGDPVGQSAGLALLARLSTFENVLAEGLESGARAVAIADADPSGAAHQYIPIYYYAHTAHDADQLEVALELVARGNQLAETHGMAWTLPLFGSVAAACHYRRGDLDRAAAEAEVAAEVAQRTTSRQTLMWAHATLALVAVEVDDLGNARRSLDAGVRCWTEGQSSMGVSAIVLANARVTAAEGDTTRALADLEVAWDLFEAVGTPFCQPEVAYDLFVLARAHGRQDLVERAIGATRVAASASGVAAIDATAEWMAAVHSDDGAAAQTALDRLRRGPRRLEVAHWLAHEPELLGDDALSEALAMFDELGATGPAAQVRERLVAQGRQPEGALAGWDSLTPTELEIARLLAEGSTNAQIAQQRGSSRRTVESHLGRIYQKLRIDGRVKLTVAAADRFRSELS
ncbi:MAG: ATP-binding protein [Acidimicrobiales bacterium]